VVPDLVIPKTPSKVTSRTTKNASPNEANRQIADADAKFDI
jgi:hypothetical protein